MATLKFIADKVKTGELVFDDNIRKLVVMLIHSNVRIDKNDELAIFDLEDNSSLILELMKARILSKDAQIKLFSLENAEEIILHYIEEDYLCEEAVDCIFNMPEDVGHRIFQKYIEIHPLERYAKEVAEEKGWL